MKSDFCRFFSEQLFVCGIFISFIPKTMYLKSNLVIITIPKPPVTFQVYGAQNYQLSKLWPIRAKIVKVRFPPDFLERLFVCGIFMNKIAQTSSFKNKKDKIEIFKPPVNFSLRGVQNFGLKSIIFGNQPFFENSGFSLCRNFYLLLACQYQF